jgi:hypothetical protein
VGQAGNHDGQFALEFFRFAGGLDAGEDVTGFAIADIQRQLQQFPGTFDVVGFDDASDAQECVSGSNPFREMTVHPDDYQVNLQCCILLTRSLSSLIIGLLRMKNGSFKALSSLPDHQACVLPECFGK